VAGLDTNKQNTLTTKIYEQNSCGLCSVQCAVLLPETLENISVRLSCMLCEQPGRDVSGAAIALFTARLHQPSQTSHQAVLNALILQLDVAMERF